MQLAPGRFAGQVERPYVVQQHAATVAAEHDDAVPNRIVDSRRLEPGRHGIAHRRKLPPGAGCGWRALPHVVEQDTAGSAEYQHPVAHRVVDGGMTPARVRRASETGVR